MNKRRLLKLAEFLETAELPGRFNMDVWAKKIDHGRPACGTAACALGWATTIPSFRRAGLRMRPVDDTTSDSWNVPIFDGSEGVRAARDFFDMEFVDALDIFDPAKPVPTGKRGRRIVARRIRKLVERAP